MKSLVYGRSRRQSLFVKQRVLGTGVRRYGREEELPGQRTKLEQSKIPETQESLIVKTG